MIMSHRGLWKESPYLMRYTKTLQKEILMVSGLYFYIAGVREGTDVYNRTGQKRSKAT